MESTKEKILLTALRLFAKKGFEAVSVSQIASELGMVKSALYKHYQSKEDIFDQIIARINELDLNIIKEFQMPEGSLENVALEYRTLDVKKITEYTIAQFKVWTENEFSCLLRRMLTVEQYGNEKMARLYQYYLGSGPINGMEKLFSIMLGDSSVAKLAAFDFYSPVYLMYSIYDNDADHQIDFETLICQHVRSFTDKYEKYLLS